MGKVQKVTITPILGLPQPFVDNDTFSSRDLPFDISQGVSLADVRAQMKDLDLTLWSREFLSKHDVKRIQGWEYALVHTYSEEEYLHGDEELQSRELLHKIFIAL